MNANIWVDNNNYLQTLSVRSDALVGLFLLVILSSYYKMDGYWLTYIFYLFNDNNKGQFLYTYQPTYNAAGLFKVGASHPRVFNNTIQTSFEILGNDS